MTLSEALRERARALVADRLGLDFPERRAADLDRGLAQAFCASGASSPVEYLTRLEALPEESPEWSRLAGHFRVGETYFFRDGPCFDALEHRILPPLIAARRSQGIRRLRLWSAGCATGEEPYSLAILLDRLLPGRADWALTILATDFDPEALERACRGIYREWSFRRTPPWIRDRYFRRRGTEAFELDARIREIVTFAPLNLAQDVYPSLATNTSVMDVILCRNVLMYFTREAQQAAVTRLVRALAPGGWLVAGPAETSSELFRPLAAVTFPGAIFYAKAPAERVSSPPLPQAEPVGPVLPPGPPAPVEELVTPAAGWERPAHAPPDADAHLERARVEADCGNLEEAERLCRAALDLDRLDADAHLLLAAICQERADVSTALEALRAAIFLAPGSASAHFLLGSLLIGRGERSRGTQSMETVVSLLRGLPPDEPVPGADGLTAGRLAETAYAYLESPWR